MMQMLVDGSHPAPFPKEMKVAVAEEMVDLSMLVFLNPLFPLYLLGWEPPSLGSLDNSAPAMGP